MNIGDRVLWADYGVAKAHEVEVVTNEYASEKGQSVVVRDEYGITFEVSVKALTPLPKVEYAAVFDLHTYAAINRWRTEKETAAHQLVGYVARTQQPDGSYKYGWEGA